MPIEGLTEQLRIPRLGKIRLGIKVKPEKGPEYPKAVDYFVCDDPAFTQQYGPKPKSLPIAFPTDDPGQFASQFYRSYSRGRGLLCRGDGVTCRRLVHLEDYQQDGVVDLMYGDDRQSETTLVDLPCQGRNCDYYRRKQCREIMMLQFLLHELPGLGVWQLDTSSINSMLNINASIRMVKSIVGHVALVPLRLELTDQIVTAEGKKKTVHVLQLTIEGRITELRGRSLLPDAEDEIPELFPTEEEPQEELKALPPRAQAETKKPLAEERQVLQDASLPPGWPTHISTEPKTDLRLKYDKTLTRAKELGIKPPAPITDDAPDSFIQQPLAWLEGKISEVEGGHKS